MTLDRGGIDIWNAWKMQLAARWNALDAATARGRSSKPPPMEPLPRPDPDVADAAREDESDPPIDYGL